MKQCNKRTNGHVLLHVRVNCTSLHTLPIGREEKISFHVRGSVGRGCVHEEIMFSWLKLAIDQALNHFLKQISDVKEDWVEAHIQQSHLRKIYTRMS